MGPNSGDKGDGAYLRAFLESDGCTGKRDARTCLELVVAMRVAFVARAWIARANQLFRGKGYTASQRAHLYVLASKPAGLTQSELAEILRISEPSLSRRIKLSLEEGLISRHQFHGDGRANIIRLEPKGLEALQSSDQTARLDRACLLHGVTDEDLTTTARVLKILSDRIQAPVDNPLE
jgi:MarR family transcriptional regulator for hemolysin